MNKIAFIQPELPHYRERFFEILSEKYIVSIYHSGIQKRMDSDAEFATITVSQITVFKRLFIQLLPLRKILKDNDIIIINGNLRYLMSIILLVICYIRGKKIIWWGHLVSANGKDFWIRVRLQVSKLASKILFYTEYESKLAVNKYGYLKNKCCYLSNGLDIDSIKDLRREYEPHKRNIDILFCGRFTKKSNLVELFKALDMIAIPLRVVLIGGELNNMQIPVSPDKSKHSIIGLGAITDESVLSTYFNDAKLFVYPGSAGLSVVHAASYGIPILVSDAWKTHMPEISIVRDFYAGHTFKYDDAKELSKTIRCLLQNANMLKEYSKNGVKACEDRFNIRAMVRNLDAVVSDV